MEVAVMGTHTIHRTSVPATQTSGDHGRILFTVVGGAALVVSAFLNWSRDMTGTALSNHSLIETSFLSQTDIVRTVGGLAVVIGLVGMFGLVDRSGWLTRLFGLLGVALFVMFLIEVLRSNVHTLQAGAWLALGGAIAMLIGGFLPGYAYETRGEPMVVEERRVDETDPTVGQRDPRRYDTAGTDAESEPRRPLP
jgi:hypothetical protein